jgi:hypothetical protein
MQFDFTEYQATANDAIAHLTARYRAIPVNAQTHLYSADLDEELVGSGFLGIAEDPDLGGVSAAHLVMEVAQLPFCAEIMASALIHWRLCPDLPRPLALASAGQVTRFAPIARTVMVDCGDDLKSIVLNDADVTPVSSLFAYPYGVIAADALDRGASLGTEALQSFRNWRRVGLAAEICGAMQSALAVTVDHVTQRQQFGRPIGANQAVQHRLAEVGVLVEGVRWLVYQAAYSGEPADAALVAAYAQDAVAKVCYDLHQFSGAMGLTLEHSLHLWTYRLRALVSEMGGPAAQYEAAASLVWGDPEPADAAE